MITAVIEYSYQMLETLTFENLEHFNNFLTANKDTIIEYLITQEDVWWI